MFTYLSGEHAKCAYNDPIDTEEMGNAAERLAEVFALNKGLTSPQLLMNRAKHYDSEPITASQEESVFQSLSHKEPSVNL